MPDIIFPLSSAPGRRPIEGQGRLVNAMTEQLGPGGQADHARRPSPGLRFLVDTLGEGACRGFLFVSNVLLVARGERLIKIERAGEAYTATDIGGLAGEGPVYFERNNKAPTPDIVAVSSEGAFQIDLVTGPVSFIDPDLDQPNSVTFQDGYFIFTLADGRIVTTGINDTSVNPLDFTTAQARPGGLYRGISFGQQTFAFGPNSIEVFTNTAQAEGFPFTRAAVIPRGLIAPDAVAGFEDGWVSSLIWVGDDRAVYRLDGGYVPSLISTPDIDRALQSVSDVGSLHALVFTHPGHPCWAIIGPNFAWVYDLSTGFWHERQSYLAPNWLARGSVRAFGEWVVGHAANGRLYRIDDDYRREGDEPLVMRITSAQGAAFPNRLAVPRADFNFVVGQGVANGEQPIETDPRCWISYSDDGGNLFSTPVWRHLGRQGEYGTRISINRCGLTGPVGRVWRLEMSDPVYATLLSGTHEIDARPR
jgi:hypothetical protein